MHVAHRKNPFSSIVSLFKKEQNCSKVISVQHEHSRAFDMLATQIYKKLEENQWRTFGVFSPRDEDGASSVVFNLAKSMARELKHTIMVVDLNVYNPSIHKLFDVANTKNLKHLLEGKVTLAEIMLSPNLHRLKIVPAGFMGAEGADLLSSHYFSELVREIKERYHDRVCIFDMPSFLNSNTSLTITPCLDTLLMVVREGKSTKADIERVARLLGDKKLLGVVLNDKPL
jgi:protein-tyrosine kinase